MTPYEVQQQESGHRYIIIPGTEVPTLEELRQIALQEFPQKPPGDIILYFKRLYDFKKNTQRDVLIMSTLWRDTPSQTSP